LLQEDERDSSRLKSVFVSAELKAVPYSVAVSALRHVVESYAGEELVKSLEQHEVWQKIQDEDKYWQGYIALARLVSVIIVILLLYNEYFYSICSRDNCAFPSVMFSPVFWTWINLLKLEEHSQEGLVKDENHLGESSGASSIQITVFGPIHPLGCLLNQGQGLAFANGRKQTS